jgi:hypothetical protein
LAWPAVEIWLAISQLAEGSRDPAQFQIFDLLGGEITPFARFEAAEQQSADAYP